MHSMVWRDEKEIFYELQSLRGSDRSRTESICYKYRTDSNAKPKYTSKSSQGNGTSYEGRCGKGRIGTDERILNGALLCDYVSVMEQRFGRLGEKLKAGKCEKFENILTILNV